MTKATSTDDKPLSAEELGTEEEDSQEESAQYIDSPELPTEEAAARVMEVFAKDGALKKIISARKSDFVHHLIHLEGKKFDFTGRNYLRPIYDRNDRQILLKTSRQVEKTTFLANNLTITSVVNPFNKSLYVSPSHTQTRQFSNEKLRPAIEKSPLIQKYFQDSFVSTQVFEKGFTNGSYVFLRSAFRSADRARGISARVLCVKGDTTVFLEDGQIVTIADLVREGPIGKRVLTLNEKTWALEYDEIIRATISPGKPSLRITSASGNFVELTEDHPVMTWDGWKKAGGVTVNDSILEARRIPSPKGSFFVNGGGDSDCCWQKVAAVESVPEEVVYDLTLRKNHNFFANTILVHNCLDEIQDMLTTEIPVIVECTSHFPDANVFMAGTPKSFDNPIEIYWQSTTQNEWLVPCTCGKWNFLDETNVAPTDLYLSGKLPPGPVCKKCMTPLHVPSGQWVSFAKGNQIQGYRIPQLMVPWICGLYEQWIKLLWKRDNYPFGQFSNEVLGLSYDSASKPITRDEILECCQDYSLWTNDRMNEAREEAQRYILTAGVDWGEGNDGSERSPSGKVRNASYTVLTVGGYIDQKTYKVFYAKRYEGREVDPDFVVKDIARICGNLGVKLVGVDWGHGWGVNNTLIRLLGAQRVVQFQYLPKLKQVMKWDQIGYRYHIQRNFIMSELFFDLKNKLIQFPRWKETEAFAKDILAIYSEYSEFRREIRYDHRPSDPDDFFHSLNYSKLASDIFLGKSRRYTLDVAREGMMK